MLQAPAPSPYDLNLRLIGFPVRVSFTFWIGSVLFGYGIVRSVEFAMADESPGMAPLLVLWAGCMLVSILVHEMGHAVAFRCFGVPSRIVLYHMGGLAIPTRGDGYGDGYSDDRMLTLSPGRSLIVSAAGPVTQLGSAVLLAALIHVAGYYVDGLRMLPGGVDDLINRDADQILSSPIARAAVIFYVLPSVFWAVLNCVPVYPLDGGRVVRSLVELLGAPAAVWLWTGVIVGGAMAAYGYWGGQLFLAILFAVLAVSNYQTASRL